MKNLLKAVAIAATCAASAAHGQTIEWKVSDRFRLWDQARIGPYVVSLEQVLDRVSVANEPKAVESAMLQFLATQDDLYQKAYWRNDLEIYDREYIWPASYRVQVRVTGLQGVCRWTASAGRLNKDEASCADLVEITIDAAADGSGSLPTEVGVRTEAGAATLTIQVRDRLIASIGDSFAAGEGNPDVPMDARRLPRRFAAEEIGQKGNGRAGWEALRFVRWKQDWQDRWLGRAAVVGFAGGADWWDPRCHRSFHSQHMVAALRYAAARPHEATTFITYACSGAKTFEGLMVRQSEPPGFNDRRRHKKLTYAQVEVMVANLCEPRLGRSAREDRRREWHAYGKLVSEQTWRCVDGVKSRSVDALMVTDGGNDVGFGPVIQDAMLPRGGEIAPKGRPALKVLRALVEARTPQHAGRDIKDNLPRHYDQLRERLAEILPAGTPILQSVYPNPLYSDEGVICGGEVASRRLAAMNGFWPDKEVDPESRWQMRIDVDEANAAYTDVVEPLNKAVGKHVREGASSGWRLVDKFSGAFARRGWCADAVGEDPGALPNWSPGKQQWVIQRTRNGSEFAWSPTAWSPYASRARLFRTPNDAAMTQQPANPRRRLGPFAPLANSFIGKQQESLLGAMSGSFHPTFEAHAIMGWSVGEELLNALPAEP
jgi:hypothetical protein